MSTIGRAFAALAAMSAAAIWSIAEPAIAQTAIRAVPTMSTGHAGDVGEFVDETRRRRDAWFTQQLEALSAEQRRVLDEAIPVLKKLAEQ